MDVVELVKQKIRNAVESVIEDGVKEMVADCYLSTYEEIDEANLLMDTFGVNVIDYIDQLEE